MTAIPVYPCEKCGAVCDVRWIQATSREEYERQAEMLRNDKGASFGVFFSPEWVDFKAGLSGEHLALTCPRCGWRSRHDVLITAASVPRVGVPEDVTPL